MFSQSELIKLPALRVHIRLYVPPVVKILRVVHARVAAPVPLQFGRLQCEE